MTTSNACASNECSAIATSALPIYLSTNSDPNYLTCSADGVAQCMRRCGSCAIGDLGSSVDTNGEACTEYCATSCAAQDPVWLPACAVQQTCPPKGVAGYKFKFRTALRIARSAFTAAKQAAFKVRPLTSLACAAWWRCALEQACLA